jgi:hypothetical protein
MCESLIKQSKKNIPTIFLLCLDDESKKEILKWDKFKGENIILVTLKEIEKWCPKLAIYREDNPWSQYCWLLASYLCWYTLEIGEQAEVLYVDSDIYFYQDPEAIFGSVGAKSVGIIRHRHNTSLSVDGEYNVGVVYFRNDVAGNSVLNWWTKTMISGVRPDLATCGDQKYLEQFAWIQPDDVHVIDDIGHGAPWNFRLYCYDYYKDSGDIVWGDKKQKLLFNHFSRFDYDLEKMTMTPTSGQYADHTLNFQVFNIPEIKQMYIDYFLEIKKMRDAT